MVALSFEAKMYAKLVRSSLRNVCICRVSVHGVSTLCWKMVMHCFCVNFPTHRIRANDILQLTIDR